MLIVKSDYGSYTQFCLLEYEFSLQYPISYQSNTFEDELNGGRGGNDRNGVEVRVSGMVVEAEGIEIGLM